MRAPKQPVKIPPEFKTVLAMPGLEVSNTYLDAFALHSLECYTGEAVAPDMHAGERWTTDLRDGSLQSVHAQLARQRNVQLVGGGAESIA